MIISKIQGGLGNQMFQYAYGKHLSYKYNTDIRFDIRFYVLDTTPKREFLLNKFPNTFINTDINISFTGPVYRISDDFNYREFINEVGCNYYLDGYWQSEKFFKESEDLIREDLKPSEEILEKIEKTPFLDTNTISLHVRRTDYVTSNGFHPVQSIEYYKNALNIIGDYDYIFVFSDDIQWCKENLTFDNMIFIEGFDDVEDLLLMSLCKNNIIANSSFSWWGAWLNNNPNKKVVAPINWFGDNTNLSSDCIIPNNWIKI
jgi:hypothetical protein